MNKTSVYCAGLLVSIFCGGVFPKGHSPNLAIKPNTSVNVVAQVATEQLIPGEEKRGSIPAAEPGSRILSGIQFTVQYPGGGAKLKLEFHPDRPVNLYARRNLPVTMDGDKVVHDSDLSPFRQEVYSIPFFPPFDAATYFLAIENYSPVQVNFTLKVTLSGPPDADTIDLSVPERTQLSSFELGSIPMPAEPNTCALGRTQYVISVLNVQECHRPSSWTMDLRGAGNLNLYAREGQRVAVEDGKVVADFTSRLPTDNGSFSVSGAASQTVGVRTFFIAVGNCNSDDTVYSLSFLPTVPDLPPPIITNVSLEGKSLHVRGTFFENISTSMVLFDGEPQKTKYDGDLLGALLIVKGARHKIGRGETVMVSVKLRDCTTRAWPFVRRK